jgi:TonB family protein
MAATTADLVQTVTLVEATPQLLDDSPMSDSIAAADDQAVPGSDTQSQVVLPGSLASLEASTISKPVLAPAVSAGSVAAEPELNVGGGLPVADEAPEDDVLESTDSVAFKLDPPSPQLELDTGDPEELLDASAQETQSLYPFSELTIISQKAPIYPRRALPGTSGSVDLEFTVTEAGKVRDVAAQGELPRSFIRAATQALRRWRFEPVLEDGEPVQVRTEVRVTFRG